jgi:hypothetical protein
MALTGSEAVRAFEQYFNVRNDLDVRQSAEVEAKYRELWLQLPDASERTYFRDQVARLVGQRRTPAARSLTARLQTVLDPTNVAAGVQLGVATAAARQANRARAEASAFQTVSFVDIPRQAAFTYREFIRVAEMQVGVLQRKQNELSQVRAQQEHELQQTTRDRDATMNDLVQTILPDLSTASLVKASQVTGLPEKQIADVAGDREKLDQQLADAKSRATSALGVLAGKVATSPDAAIAAADRRLAGFNQERDRLSRELAALSDAKELIDAGYGTDRYNRYPTWFTWYGEKFKANAIVKRTGKSDFAAVRAAYEKLAADFAAIDGEFADLRGAKDRVHAERSSVADLETQIRMLPKNAYVRARETVARVIRNTPQSTLARTLSPALAATYKTYAALAAKVEYMGELRQNMASLEREVANERTRVEGEIQWARHKISNGDSRRLRDKSVLWRLGYWDYTKRDKVYRAYWTAYRQVYGYDAYDRSPSLLETWFWWNVFTDSDPYYSRYEKVYRPTEIEQYTRTNPDYRYHPPKRSDVEAAAAAAAADAQRREQERIAEGDRRQLDPHSRVGFGASTRIAS